MKVHHTSWEWDLERADVLSEQRYQRRQRNRYRCGGIGSYEGSCGADDCSRCHPGYDPRDEEEE